jgi:hypothetical protein
VLGSLLGCINDYVSTRTVTREWARRDIRDKVDLGVRAKPGCREASAGSVNSSVLTKMYIFQHIVI